MGSCIDLTLLSHGQMKKEELNSNVVAAAAASSKIVDNISSTESTEIISTRPCELWDEVL